MYPEPFSDSELKTTFPGTFDARFLPKHWLSDLRKKKIFTFLNSCFKAKCVPTIKICNRDIVRNKNYSYGHLKLPPSNQNDQEERDVCMSLQYVLCIESLQFGTL